MVTAWYDHGTGAVFCCGKLWFAGDDVVVARAFQPIDAQTVFSPNLAFSVHFMSQGGHASFGQFAVAAAAPKPAAPNMAEQLAQRIAAKEAMLSLQLQLTEVSAFH